MGLSEEAEGTSGAVGLTYTDIKFLCPPDRSLKRYLRKARRGLEQFGHGAIERIREFGDNFSSKYPLTCRLGPWHVTYMIAAPIAMCMFICLETAIGKPEYYNLTYASAATIEIVNLVSLGAELAIDHLSTR